MPALASYSIASISAARKRASRGSSPPVFVSVTVTRWLLRRGHEAPFRVGDEEIDEERMDGLESAQLFGDGMFEDGAHLGGGIRERGPSCFGRGDLVGGWFIRCRQAFHQIRQGNPRGQILDLLVDAAAEAAGEMLGAGLKKGALRLAIVAVTEHLRRHEGQAKREDRGKDEDADELGPDAQFHGGDADLAAAKVYAAAGRCK